jgi:hypothetical protein
VPVLQQAAWSLAALRLGAHATTTVISSGERPCGVIRPPPCTLPASSARACRCRRLSARSDAAAMPMTLLTGLPSALFSSRSSIHSRGSHRGADIAVSGCASSSGRGSGVVAHATHRRLFSSSHDPASDAGAAPAEGPEALYNAGIAAGTYRPDPLQAVTVEKLQVGLRWAERRSCRTCRSTFGGAVLCIVIEVPFFHPLLLQQAVAAWGLRSA